METSVQERQAAVRAAQVQFWKSKIKQANEAFAASLSAQLLEHKKRLVAMFDTMEVQAHPDAYDEVVFPPQQVAEQILQDVLDKIGEAPRPKPADTPAEQHQSMPVEQEADSSDTTDLYGVSDPAEPDDDDDDDGDVVMDQAPAIPSEPPKTVGKSSRKAERINIYDKASIPLTGPIQLHRALGNPYDTSVQAPSRSAKMDDAAWRKEFKRTQDSFKESVRNVAKDHWKSVARDENLKFIRAIKKLASTHVERLLAIREAAIDAVDESLGDEVVPNPEDRNSMLMRLKKRRFRSLPIMTSTKDVAEASRGSSSVEMLELRH
ncbi:hypothetical protein QBC34DRAFT_444448 [Podospora aff. communis PSN243]|uniref:HMG box domain-containing protein n=1 Tax=Podospora aff. communis PSN243 TaxID=3040156 RepID=A0AAV9G0P7_9PEZI|nr:hypothetical protein QBC34DRAFT_444448 [Podospora aff. communis PSN243]